MNFEGNFSNPEKEAKKKIGKIVTAFVTAGIMTLGPGNKMIEEIMHGSSSKDYVEYSRSYTGGNEMEEEALREKLNFLEDKFSSAAINTLALSNQSEKKKAENEPARVVVSGFEKVGVDDRDLENLWSQNFYPAGIIENNVSEIEFLEKNSKNVEGYNIEGNMAASAGGFSEKISFYASDNAYKNMGIEERIKTLDWHFSHELGHSADWKNNNNLNPVERAEFLYEVAKTFEKPGSFRDVLGYIDSINNPDKQKENYYKVTEYWAELCQTYLTFPDLIKEEGVLSAEEVALVKKWMQKEDKEFDPLEAKKKKDVFIREMAEKGSEK
jgi:hypothetical protein